VGRFSIDRGHQAPVGHFNADRKAATMTKVPINLSPENAYLNQRPWNWLEQEMRVKGQDTSDSDVTEIELITGPLYEIPEAFFKSGMGSRAW
jgi:DNA/RNA endonuclease G (NUC1)